MTNNPSETLGSISILGQSNNTANNAENVNHEQQDQIARSVPATNPALAPAYNMMRNYGARSRAVMGGRPPATQPDDVGIFSLTYEQRTTQNAFGFEDETAASRAKARSRAKAKARAKPMTPREMREFHNNKMKDFLSPGMTAQPSTSQAKESYFGTPTYGGLGFNGVGTAGYASNPGANSAHGDHGDGASASPGPSEASDTGMGNEPGGMGVGSDTGGGSGGGWGLPVVLDLGRDGITIVPLSQSTARFDLAGRGSRQVVAWPGPDDALLVYDRDGDRLISHRDEIAFAHYLANAKTDLEGLAWFDQLAQGGNADGVLDERDALWSDFGVWRDADQDGETDPGELRMSGDGSISSINLTSDQQPQDVGPDARVSGKSTYEYLDHNGIVQTAEAYDTALQYREADARHQRRAASLYDHPTSRSDYAPPRLVRRDGQPLSRVESLYPTMCYDDAIHEHCPSLTSRHRPNLK